MVKHINESVVDNVKQELAELEAKRQQLEEQARKLKEKQKEKERAAREQIVEANKAAVAEKLVGVNAQLHKLLDVSINSTLAEAGFDLTSEPMTADTLAANVTDTRERILESHDFSNDSRTGIVIAKLYRAKAINATWTQDVKKVGVNALRCHIGTSWVSGRGWRDGRYEVRVTVTAATHNRDWKDRNYKLTLTWNNEEPYTLEGVKFNASKIAQLGKEAVELTKVQRENAKRTMRTENNNVQRLTDACDTQAECKERHIRSGHGRSGYSYTRKEYKVGVLTLRTNGHDDEDGTLFSITDVSCQLDNLTPDEVAVINEAMEQALASIETARDEKQK